MHVLVSFKATRKGPSKKDTSILAVPSMSVLGFSEKGQSARRCMACQSSANQRRSVPYVFPQNKPKKGLPEKHTTHNSTCLKTQTTHKHKHKQKHKHKHTNTETALGGQKNSPGKTKSQSALGTVKLGEKKAAQALFMDTSRSNCTFRSYANPGKLRLESKWHTFINGVQLQATEPKPRRLIGRVSHPFLPI